MRENLKVFKNKKIAVLAIATSLIILVIYKMWKYSLREYFHLDPVEDYFTYEGLNSVGRTLGAILCWYLTHKLYKAKDPIYKSDYPSKSISYIPYIWLGFVILSINKVHSVFSINFLREFFICLPVGFFEEFSFKALLFVGLCAFMKKRYAIILSSFLFSLWHFDVSGAYFTYFIFLFLYGVSSSLLYLLGASWLELSIFHSVYDIIVFGVQGAFSDLFPTIYYFELILPVILLNLYLFNRKKIF